MTEENQPKTEQTLEAQLEALLFVASGPVSSGQLAEALNQPLAAIESGLNELDIHLTEGRGLRLQRHSGRFQLTTAPELGELVEHYLGLEVTSRLSRAALETLAIVAYRQPITRPAIDMIRGVNSDGVVKSLLSKGLIEETGRSDSPGRPILYATTSDFLQHFGLASLNDMPPYEMADEGQVLADNKLLKD